MPLKSPTASNSSEVFALNIYYAFTIGFNTQTASDVVRS